MYQIGNPTASLGGSWTAEPFSQASPGAARTVAAARADGVAYASFPGAGAGIGSPFDGAGGSWSSTEAGGLAGVMASFGQAIQGVFAQITAALNGSSASSGTTCPSGPAEQKFASASASSLGDPHLSFDGTTAAGSTQSGKWDNMQSHADLIDSDSFAGGYRVATTATSPSAKGVTYNQSATVTTDGGSTAVTFSSGGTLQVTQRGESVAMQPGQTADLGNGESVTSNADGSATVTESNQSGGSIATTLKSNGNGVDVSTSATGVDLGGYLVRGRDAGTPRPMPVVSGADASTLAGGPWNDQVLPSTGALE